MIENYVAGNDDVSRVSEFVWHSSGQLERLTLVNAETGDQITRWFFGTTLEDSGLASNSLLRTKIYPDSDDRATTSGGALNETRYVLTDYFNPAAIVDATGAVKERYAFTAFGVRQIMDPDFNFRTVSESVFDFGFQGQFLDVESGLINYGYRYYSPYLGRWTCKDPIGELGGLNLYAVVDNGPVNIVDHLGLAVPPVYNPSIWNVNPEANNRYTYACDRLKPVGTDKFPNQQPGYEADDPLPKATPESRYTCPSVKEKAKKDGLKDATIKNGKTCCPKGYHQVRLFVGDHVREPAPPIILEEGKKITVPPPKPDQGNDYHWYRLDTNGKWSSKHGPSVVGPQVTDPAKDAKEWW